MSSAGYMNKHIQKQHNKGDDSKSSISYQSKTTYKSNLSNQKKSDATKQDIMEQMKQNEDKHKQMMLENQRRRKEKERKLKEEEEKKRQQENKILGERKKTKEQAYIRYLRNNSKKVMQEFGRDMPEQQQMNERKIQTHYPKPPRNNFEALDVETVFFQLKLIISQKFSQRGAKNKIKDEFEQDWNEKEEFEIMKKSELLDSLNLEVSTRPKIKKSEKPNDQNIEELIGYEEAKSDDDDQIWNNTLRDGKMLQERSKFKKKENTMEWGNQMEKEVDDVLSKDRVKQNKSVDNNSQKKVVNSQKPPIQQEQKIVTQIQTTQNRQQSVGKQTQQVKCQQQKKTVSLAKPRKKSPKSINTKEEENQHVQEFLKDDLMSINQQEYALQQDLHKFNLQTQQKIENVNNKYDVRNDLQSSKDVRGGPQSLQYIPDKQG